MLAPRNSIRAAILSVVVLLGGVVINSTAAIAAPNDASGDQGVAAPAPAFTSGQLASMHQKDGLRDRYVAAKQGHESVSTVEADIARVYGTSAVSSPRMTPAGAVSPSIYYWNATNISQQPQEKSYYCGPGSGYAIFKGKGKVTSAYNGQSLSQSVLGSTTYLSTDLHTGTNWSDSSGYPMQTTLNRWLGTSWYIPAGAPSLSAYENDLVVDVDHGYAFAANVVEMAGGTHLPGHPVSKTIYHWVAPYGYSSSDGITANTTSYADPAGQSTAVSWGMGVYAYNNVASSTMKYLVGQRGIIW
jgi:hypothetical protein